ncbi:SurA N-terminal domain-containing protein [bacterium]|nr:SurA N-terminal domain-containing protein [bacterium]
MFQDIRKKGSSLLITLMFAAIIVTFVISFGPGDKAGCSSVQNGAGTVNGEVITMSEFRVRYSNLIDYYQRIFKDFNNEMAKQLKLSEKVFDEFVNMILLAQEAERLGFKVSDEEVSNVILKDPSFQKNGVFDKETYNNMVKMAMNTTVSEYENRLRMRLLAIKLQSYLVDNITVSDTEAQDEFVAANEKIDALVYVFADSNLKSDKKNELMTAITDDEVAAYLKDNESKAKMAFEDNVSKYSKGEGQTVFEDVKKDVAKDLLFAPKLEEKIKADSEKLLGMLKEKPELSAEEISSAFAEWDLKGRGITLTKKSSPLTTGLIFDPKFIEKLFSDPEPKIVDEVLKTEDGKYVVAEVKKHTVADMSEFAASKEFVKSNLVTAKKGQIFEAYVKKLKANANIEINSEFLKLFEGGEK